MRNELIKKYNTLKLSFLGISKLSDISKQTIYNNDELEKYIDKIMEKQEKDGIFSQIKLLQEQLNKQQDKI